VKGGAAIGCKWDHAGTMSECRMSRNCKSYPRSLWVSLWITLFKSLRRPAGIGCHQNASELNTLGKLDLGSGIFRNIFIPNEHVLFF
jgi:hypothetical protein